MRTKRLQSQLDTIIRDNGIPGAVACFSSGGNHIWTGAAGIMDIHEGTPMDPGARFYIYSITKTFIATLLLRLSQDAVISLDDPIEKWFDSGQIPWKAPLRRVLNHTAGIPDYGPLHEYQQAVRGRPSNPWTFDEFIEHVKSGKQDLSAGEGWCYSNTGYMILKRIVEKVTSQPLSRALQENIFLPLGLHDTSVPEDFSGSMLLTPGYSRIFSDEGTMLDIRALYHPGWVATGVIISTAAEGVRFFESLFSGSLIDDEHLSLMTALVPVAGNHPPFFNPGYGLGLMGDMSPFLGRSYSHGGEGPGFSLALSHWPSLKAAPLTAALFCNVDGIDAASLLYQIVENFTSDKAQ